MKLNKLKDSLVGWLSFYWLMATCDSIRYIETWNSYDDRMVWDDDNLATAYVNRSLWR